MAVCSITVVPLGTGSASLSKYVAGVLDVVRESGLEYQLTPMATIVEGEVREILELVEKMHNSAFSEDVVRVATTVKIDERRDKPLTMDGKVHAVMSKLGK